MIFNRDKMLAGVARISEALDEFYYDEKTLNDAEKLMILKTAASTIENAIALEGFLAMYKVTLDKISGK